MEDQDLNFISEIELTTKQKISKDSKPSFSQMSEISTDKQNIKIYSVVRNKIIIIIEI